MNTHQSTEGLREWRDSWPVVLAAFFGSGLSAVYAYSMGVMIAPLEAEFGWSRAQITSGFMMVSVFSVSLSAFMGYFIDRVGSRRIALVGVVIYGAALALLSQATESRALWWALWALIATGIMFIKPTVWVTAISGLFFKTRGVALAVVLSATGFVSLLAPRLTLFLVESFGWRTAFVYLGVGSALIVLPLVFAFFTSVTDRQRQAKPEDAQKAEALSKALPGLGVKEGLTSANFYRLAAAGLIVTLASVAITINLVPILSSQGFTREAAATTAGLVGLTQIVGRLGSGYFLDRFNARIVAAISVALPIITAVFMLAMPGHTVAALVAVVFIGLATGAELDAIAYLSAKCFGLRNFGTLFGAFTGIITLGFGFGPVLANLVYDITASYSLVLWMVIPMSILASVLFLTISAYPEFESSDEPTGASEAA